MSHRRSGERNWLSLLTALFGWRLDTETQPRLGGRSIFSRSIFLRHLDGGSTNAPEMELAALSNPIYDLAQYGIHFVPSPRHADILIVTGPLTWNMLGPTLATFEAMPEPKRIVTVGDCASFSEQDASPDCPFSESYAVADLPSEMKTKIAAHVAGDPPTPRAIIQSLLRLDKK